MIKSLLAAMAMLVVSVVSVPAWTTVQEMNTQIDQTNFIVGSGCSGTLISIEYKLIITAMHCVTNYISTVTREEIDEDGKVEEVQYERRRQVEVSQKDYKRFNNVGAVSYQTEIIAYEKSRDLALLQLVGDNLRSTMAAPILPKGEELYRGTAVVAVGNPRMLDASVTVGVISSTSRTFTVPWAMNEEVPMLQFDANIQPGSSGGGVFDSTGRYIGTVVAAFPGSDLSLAIPVFELQDLLAANCFASLYDEEADDELCRNPPEEADDE